MIWLDRNKSYINLISTHQNWENASKLHNVNGITVTENQYLLLKKLLHYAGSHQLFIQFTTVCWLIKWTHKSQIWRFSNSKFIVNTQDSTIFLKTKDLIRIVLYQNHSERLGKRNMSSNGCIVYIAMLACC